MSYETMAILGQDETFRGRVVTCSKEQALTFKDDGRYSIAALATAIIQSTANAQGLVDVVCVYPNFRDVADQGEVDDADILSAVQAAWPVFAEAFYPEPPPS